LGLEEVVGAGDMVVAEVVGAGDVVGLGEVVTEEGVVGAGDMVIAGVVEIGDQVDTGLLVLTDGGSNVITVPRLPNGHDGVIPAQDGGETPIGDEEL